MFATDLTNGFLETVSALREINLTYDEAVQVFQRRLRDRIQTYVVLIEGRVVGTASLLIEQKYIHGGGLVGHVEDVAIHQAYQGRGIGRTLMQHLIAECRDYGCYKILLECTSQLMPFYQGLGFREWNHNLRLDLK